LLSVLKNLALSILEKFIDFINGCIVISQK